MNRLDLHIGISQLPYAVEAVFPVGPIEVVINRETMQTVDTRHGLAELAADIKANGQHEPVVYATISSSPHSARITPNLPTRLWRGT